MTTLAQDFYSILTELEHSRVVVQEYGAVAEVIDITKKTKLRRFSGINFVFSPDQTRMAWQTAVDILKQNQRSHVILAEGSGDGQIDLGEGRAPLFLGDNSTLVFFRDVEAQNRIDIIRYHIDTKTYEIQQTKESESGGFGTGIFGIEGSTLSPDGLTIVVSTSNGRYGSAIYWRLTAAGEWELIDDNLAGWGGWSQNRLIYATDGRDLRPWIRPARFGEATSSFSTPGPGNSKRLLPG